MMAVALRDRRGPQQSGRLGAASAYTGSGLYLDLFHLPRHRAWNQSQPGMRPATVIPGWWPAS